MTHTRPQSAIENCTWHNFNVVPTYKGYYAVSGNYQSGISVIDFTNPAAATEVAFADPAPSHDRDFQPTAGDWSTHFYNGKIYESDIRRGLIIWDLDHDAMRRVRTPDLSNPQTQMASFAQDLEGPAITIAAPLEGGQFMQNSQQIADFSCADNDSGVESCVGTVADGARSTRARSATRRSRSRPRTRPAPRRRSRSRTWSTAPMSRRPPAAMCRRRWR